MLVGFFFFFFFPEIRQASIKSLFEMRTEEMVVCFPVRCYRAYFLCSVYQRFVIYVAKWSSTIDIKDFMYNVLGVIQGVRLYTWVHRHSV